MGAVNDITGAIYNVISGESLDAINNNNNSGKTAQLEPPRAVLEPQQLEPKLEAQLELWV